MVARSTSRIDAFATDGVDLFMIEEQAVQACSTDGPVEQQCREVITGEEVGARLSNASFSQPPWGFGGGKKGVAALPFLAPKAIALQPGRVLVADDGYKVLIACPSKAPCTRFNVGIVDARLDDPDDAPELGRSLALGPAAVAWAQGDVIFGAPIPLPGAIEEPAASREESSTEETARVLAPGNTDLFWLSNEGLHYARDPSAPSERWFSRTGKDFSVDEKSVYLAGGEGLFRVNRADKSAALSAPGTFERVAVDPRGVYATRRADGRTTVIEARAEKQLVLASVEGTVAGLEVAGDHVYFLVQTDGASEIRRVPRD